MNLIDSPAAQADYEKDMDNPYDALPDFTDDNIYKLIGGKN